MPADKLNRALRNRARIPSTPDGRDFVVHGRLWRMSSPALAPDQRQALVDRLMRAQRGVGSAIKAGDADAERLARAEVGTTKHALGERGPGWWDTARWI